MSGQYRNDTAREAERQKAKPSQDDCRRVLEAMEKAHDHDGAALYAFRHPSDGRWIAKPLTDVS